MDPRQSHPTDHPPNGASPTRPHASLAPSFKSEAPIQSLPTITGYTRNILRHPSPPARHAAQNQTNPSRSHNLHHHSTTSSYKPQTWRWMTGGSDLVSPSETLLNMLSLVL